MRMRWLFAFAIVPFLAPALMPAPASAQSMLDPQPPGQSSPREWAAGGYWHTVHYRGGMVTEVVISPNPSSARVEANDKIAIPFTPRWVNWSVPHRTGTYPAALTAGAWKEWDIDHQGRKYTVRFQMEQYARPNLGRQPGDLSNMRWWVRCINGRNPQINNRPC